jgi:hypothetical protein
LTVSGSTLSCNSAGYGGGIEDESTGALAVTGSTCSTNGIASLRTRVRRRALTLDLHFLPRILVLPGRFLLD